MHGMHGTTPSHISPILRVPTDDSMYCHQCDMIQPAYAHVATRALYCAVCDAAYDPDLIPEDYEPYFSSKPLGSGFLPESGPAPATRSAFAPLLTVLLLAMFGSGCTRTSPPETTAMEETAHAILLQANRTYATGSMIACVPGMGREQKRYVLNLDAAAGQSYLLALADRSLDDDQAACMRRHLRDCEAEFPGQCAAVLP